MSQLETPEVARTGLTYFGRPVIQVDQHFYVAITSSASGEWSFIEGMPNGWFRSDGLHESSIFILDNTAYEPAHHTREARKRFPPRTALPIPAYSDLPLGHGVPEDKAQGMNSPQHDIDPV